MLTDDWALAMLDEMLVAQDLQAASGYFVATAQQVIRLGRSPLPVGTAGQIAGRPSLPEDVAWPESVDGRPLEFVLQLDLDVLADIDDGRLPKHGGLLFFIGEVESADAVEHAVLWLPQGLAPTPAEPPMDTTLAEQSARWCVATLAARRSIETPGYGHLDWSALEHRAQGWTDDQFDGALDLAYAFTESDDVAAMFGYPQSQHGDDALRALLWILTGSRYSSRPREARTVLAAAGYPHDVVDAEVDDMQLLLQVDSDADLGISWWDAGALQFFIRGEDLRARRFDRTYCGIYSS